MRFAFMFTSFALLVILVSCSSSRTEGLVVSPIKPYEGIEGNLSELNEGPLYPNLLGIWKVRIDTKNLSAEIEPARNAKAIGNIFDADLFQFLTHAPCSNCLRIGQVALDRNWDEFPYNFKGRLHVTFLMKHPFKNISTRPDLHGFDVRLIIIGGKNTTTMPQNIMKPDMTTEPIVMDLEFVDNPDGYTSHFDEIVTDSRYFIGGIGNPQNINPFFRFFEDPVLTNFNPHSPSGHNVMPVGSSIYNRTVTFNQRLVEEGAFEFYAVADVAYGQSAVFANRTNPQYYLPAFHRTEPWRVEYWIENNNLSDSDNTKTADVVVQVFDWQHGATVDPAYPNPSNLSGIPESSNVAQVELSAPLLMNDEVVIATTPEGGTGAPDNPLRYRLQVRNLTGYSHKVFKALLAVRDELYGHQSPSGRMPIPSSPAGFPYETLDIVDYSLYQLIYINQPNRKFYENDLFRNELDVEPKSLFMYSEDRIYATFFMDPSHTRFRYEWDEDYDGITFDVDYVGMPSDEISFSDHGLHYVGLRVTINTVPAKQYVYKIPIFYGYIGQRTQLVTSGAPLDTTYYSRNHALAMSSDYYYVVFTSEAVAGQRDVWLAVGNKSFNFTTYNLTESVNQPCYNPSIAVIDKGNPHEGVWVAYTNWNSGDPTIYSINGNLDGSGFQPSNILTVSDIAGWTETNPCLLKVNNRIYAYFQAKATMPPISNIRIAELNSMFTSWVDRGVMDNSRNAAFNPSVMYLAGSTNKVFCVFEDFADYSARGVDLYLISSTNPTSFTAGSSVNISGFSDNTSETMPSISGFNNVIAVAYLADDPLCHEPRTFVKIMNSSNIWYGSLNYEDAMPSGFSSSAPAISVCGEKWFILVTPFQNTASGDAYCKVEQISIDMNEWYFYKLNSICEVPMGNIPSSAANAFPGIISRALSGYYGIVESLIVYRSFENGRNESPSPFSMQFGNVVAMHVIAMEIED